MSQSTLQLTQFKIQKLQCIGGQGRAMPYRITTYRGMDLGTIGQIMDPQGAINESVFEVAQSGRLNKLAGRILRTFGLANTG
jgi:hypothetical protein